MKILFRTDASPEIGFGHLARCLTLASELQAREHAKIIVAHAASNPPPAEMWVGREVSPLPILSNLLNRNFGYGWERRGASRSEQNQDAAALEEALDGFEPDLIVVDHYLLDECWEDHWERSQVAAIDDLANRRHACSLLVDQNLGASVAGYRTLLPDDAKILAGPTYALLRPEFVEARPAALAKRGKTAAVGSVLVNFGASDVGALTIPVVEEILASEGSAPITVVCGSGAAALPRLRELAADPRVTLHVDSNEMARLLVEADVAIGAAGATSWERACLGLPSILIVAAENQRAIADRVVDAGAAVLATGPEDVGPAFGALKGNMARWHSMVAAAAGLTDGRGALRVAEAVRGVPDKAFSLRPASTENSLDLWAWRNEPQMRWMARSREPVTLSDHTEWFRRVLSNRDCLLYIGYCGSEPAGMVRFDFEDRIGFVAIAVAPAFRGRSLGYVLLSEGIAAAQRERGFSRLGADIRPENEPSVRTFRKAGFRFCCSEGDLDRFEWLNPAEAGGT